MVSTADELSIISNKESSKISGSITLPVGRAGVDMSNKLAS